MTVFVAYYVRSQTVRRRFWMIYDVQINRSKRQETICLNCVQPGDLVLEGPLVKRMAKRPRCNRCMASLIASRHPVQP